MESGGNPPGKEVIQLGITNSNKVINVDRIDCSGSLRVTLALTAAPDIISNPTDIVLVLDRSGSMAGTPLANMKTGAKTFIGIIEEATGGTQDGQIGSGQPYRYCQFCRYRDCQHTADHIRRYAEKCGERVDGRWKHQSADAFTKRCKCLIPRPGMPR